MRAADKITRTFVLLFSIASGGAMACPQEISEGNLETMFPKGKLLRGDLNTDGINDIAVLYSEQVAQGRQDRIAIYEGRSAGTYCLAAKSGTLEYGKTDIDLRKGSIFIVASSNTIKEWVAESYQFKYRNGRYLLIGSEESVFHPDEGDEYRDSRNYLSGKRIEKTTRNKHTKEKMSPLGVDEMALMPLDRFQR